jgi:hypothetical protein
VDFLSEGISSMPTRSPSDGLSKGDDRSND